MYTLIYSVHIVQTVQCTQCTHPLLETSSAVLCTHSTAELLSHMEAVLPLGWAWAAGGPRGGQFTASPATRWKGPLSQVYPPFLSKESFPAWSGIGRVPFPGCGQGSKQDTDTRILFIHIFNIAILFMNHTWLLAMRLVRIHYKYSCSFKMK